MTWQKFFLKQDMMRRVLYSLIPIIALSIFLFGWRVLALLAVVSTAGVLTEFLVIRQAYGGKTKVSEAVLVSCFLFTLTLPPAVPYWIAVVGIVFGVFFAKGIFGGFGRNVFNPAIVGRCFIYVSFPAYMTALWTEPFRTFPGGFARYSPGLDAIAMATPIRQTPELGEYLSLLWGLIPGSAGETSALLIILAGLYLIFTKTAAWKIMASSLAAFLVVGTVVYLTGSSAQNPLWALLSGGFLFGTVFMATDPISAPRQDGAKVLYGLLIGAVTIVIRVFANFTEGIMFSILIANTFAPLIDRSVKNYMDQQTAKIKATGKQVTG